MSSKLSTEPVTPVTRRILRRTVLLGLGAVVVAGGVGGGGLALWNYIHEHTAVFIYRGYNGPIYALSWSPTGQRLASGGIDPTGTSIWDALTGGHLPTLGDFQHSSVASNLAWSPDGTRLATVGAGNAFVWDARSGQVLTVYQEPARGTTQTQPWPGRPMAHA